MDRLETNLFLTILQCNRIASRQSNDVKYIPTIKNKLDRLETNLFLTILQCNCIASRQSNDVKYIPTIKNKLDRLETNLFLTILQWVYKLELRSKVIRMQSSNLISSSTENNSSNDSIPQFHSNKFEKILKGLHTFILLIFVATTMLWIQTSISLYIPMYPEVAMEKGLSYSEIGAIMGMSPFVTFLIYPFVNIFVNNNNFKLSFTISGIFLSVSLVLFGLLTKMDKIPFEVFSIAFQMLQAVTKSVLFLTSLAIMLRIFPKYRIIMISVYEVFVGLGYMIGPPLGGMLFDTFGFALMFFGTGTLSLILILVSVLILIPYELDMDTIEDKGNQDTFLALKLFRHFDIVLLITFVLAGSICFHYLIPVLGPFMVERHGANPGTIGPMFLSSNTVFVLSAPILGIVTTKVRFLTPFIVIGFLIQAIGTFFVPPSELFTNILNSTTVSSRDMELLSPYVGMTLVGFGFILSYLPILAELLNRAEFQDTSNITTTVTSIFNSVYYLGEGLGPLVAGLVAQNYTLDIVVVYLSGVLLLFSISALVLMIYDIISGIRRIK